MTLDSGQRRVGTPRRSGVEHPPAAPAELALLEGLVAIPSVSGEEGEAAAWLVERMRELEIIADQDQVGNVIGTVRTGPGSATAGPIYLLGHIDTVAGAWPLSLEGGRLSGRGTSDAKGPLAAFVAAAVRARERGLVRRPIHILGAVGEEASSRGARHLAMTMPPPSFLVVGEPSRSDRIVLGYQGRLHCQVEMRCQMHHTSRPEPTAAERGVERWQELRAMVAELNHDAIGFDALHIHLLAIETATDGLIDRVRMHLGFRLPPRISCTEVVDRLRQIDPTASVEVEGCDPAVTVPRSGPLPTAFSKAIRAAGMRPGWQRRLATSDLNTVLPVWRCPAVVYGPGDAELDHTPFESIAIDDYALAIEVLTEVLAEL